MAITSVRRDWNGEVDIVRMITTDTLATVAATGYLTAQAANLATINAGTWTWLPNDMVLVSASDGLKLFTVSSDLTTLDVYSTAGDGAVTLPVVSGNFTVFDGTLGALKDAGYSASNAAKTKVVMANGAVTNGNVPTFVDTAGTIGDAGYASNEVLVTSFANPDVNGNFLAVDVVVGQAALATGGSVTLQASSGSKQYKIRGICLNKTGTNFSGGGGDRNIEITDNTTVYTIGTAALVQALDNTRWGDTGLPAPATASYDTSTAAGAAIVAKYQGGTTDYTAGSLTFSLLLQRVA